MSTLIKQNAETANLSLAESLAILMEQHHIHELKLAQLTKIPQPTLHKILAGKTQDPRISTIQTLANHFNISVDDLLSGNLTSANHSTQTNMQKVPLLTWSNCNQYKSIPKIAQKEFCYVDYPNKNAFALTSKPSMSPLFPAQTTLVIDPDITPVDGDIVLILYPNTQECTLRELSIDGPLRLLHPILHGSNTDTLSDEISICGVLVQSKLSYK